MVIETEAFMAASNGGIIETDDETCEGSIDNGSASGEARSKYHSFDIWDDEE